MIEITLSTTLHWRELQNIGENTSLGNLTVFVWRNIRGVVLVSVQDIQLYHLFATLMLCGKLIFHVFKFLFL